MMPNEVDGNQILHPFGPFDLVVSPYSRGGRRVDVKRSKSAILSRIQEMQAEQSGLCGDLSRKNGLYVFAIKTPGRDGPIRPYYVGKTDKQGLLEEAFGPHQQTAYNHAVCLAKGAPVMYFIAPGGNKTKLKKQLVIDWERILIYLAYSANIDLCNTHHVPSTVRIEGVRLLRHQGNHSRGQANRTAATELNKLFDL